MAIPDYMHPLEGETVEETTERLMREFIWARGGNKPEDVARWLAEYPASMLADLYMESWGSLAEDEEYSEVTEEELQDPNLVVYEEGP